MPIYEFVCADCNKPFEELMLSPGSMDELTCPACHSLNIIKKISTFAPRLSYGSSYSFNSTLGSSCSTGNV
jgi:putative FmdB family regulatory protein